MKCEMEDYVVVVDIRFSMKGKTYSYLCMDDVRVGDTVYIKGKERGYRVLDVRRMRIADLPVPYEEMGLALILPDSDTEYRRLVSESKILHPMENHPSIRGRESELDAMMVSIHKKRMKGMILVGEAGCGKTTLAEAFADKLQDEFYFASLSIGELIAGTIYRGMLEEKVTRLFSSVLDFNRRNGKKIVLFIDEIHMITSNGGTEDGVSIHNLLKTYLTDPDVIVIGATTPSEFNRTIRRDPAFMRRMTPLMLPSLGDEEILRILLDFSGNSVGEDYLKKILKSSKEIPGVHQPDVSIEILDRLMAGRDYLHMPVSDKSIERIITDLKNSLVF